MIRWDDEKSAPASQRTDERPARVTIRRLELVSDAAAASRVVISAECSGARKSKQAPRRKPADLILFGAELQPPPPLLADIMLARGRETLFTLF